MRHWCVRRLTTVGPQDTMSQGVFTASSLVDRRRAFLPKAAVPVGNTVVAPPAPYTLPSGLPTPSLLVRQPCCSAPDASSSTLLFLWYRWRPVSMPVT